MATQAFLDATHGASFTTPTEWNTLANAWEASAFDAAATLSWIDAGIEIVAQATASAAGGLTAAEVKAVRVFFPPTGPTPTLANVIAAVSVVNGVTAAGGVLNDITTMSLLTTFFSRLTAGSVTVSVPK